MSGLPLTSGSWYDGSEAAEALQERLGSGGIPSSLEPALRHWLDHGWVCLEQAVPHDLADRILAEVERTWQRPDPRIFVEWFEGSTKHIEAVRPELQARQAKLLDLYAWSNAAREAIFSERLTGFLHALFEQPPLAFQALYFERGTQQPMHQDTAFVGVHRPLEFVGSWLALEDIGENTGELEYYDGSHRLAPTLFQGSRKMPGTADDADFERYYASLHDKAAAAGLERVRFRPRKGDVLFWHADLVHGGSAAMQEGSTRKSLVTHYCPLDNDPDYMDKYVHSGRVGAGGGSYCYPVRGAASPMGRGWLKARAWWKMATGRLTRPFRG